MKYDLHIHSCLSPCSDDDMTPNNIAGMALVAQVDLISVCDHNSTDNLLSCFDACQKYNIKFLPAIEVCTNEEIHILCYFKNLQEAIKFGDIIKNNTPKILNKTDTYGNQFIMDYQDNIVENYQNLLIIGCNFSSLEIVNLCHKYNGLCFYAHIDKQSFSVVSVLGSLPEEVPIDGVEIYNLANREKLINNKIITEDMPYISNSDAHTLADIATKNIKLEKNNPLIKLIDVD